VNGTGIDWVAIILAATILFFVMLPLVMAAAVLLT
jgi:hypothetical protein